MILWLALFILIVGVSFILAFRSMKDYQEIPQKFKVEYGLFLIRQTGEFDVDILDSLGKFMLSEGFIISIERLFKGKKAALTIFGPKNILDKFTADLNLLELEDYAPTLDSKDVSIWEIGVKNTKRLSLDNPNDIFKNLSELEDEDQFFWQVVLGSMKEGKNLSFQTQIRAVVYSKDPIRKRILTPVFQNLNFGELTKVPRPFSIEQMMDFYLLRSLSKDSNGPILTPSEVLSLFRI